MGAGRRFGSEFHLGRYFGRVVLALAILASAMFVMTQWAAGHHQAHTYEVNASGALPMLCQRAAWYAHRLVTATDGASREALRDRLRETAGAISSNRKLLTAGLYGREPIGIESHRIRRLLLSPPLPLADRIDNFAAQARHLAALPSAALTLDDPAYTALQTQAEETLIADLNTLARYYEEDHHADLLRWQVLQGFGILAATLLALVAVAWFVVRPAQGRLFAVRRTLLDSLGEGIYGVDAEGRSTFVNPAAARMLGYRPEELLGRPMHELVHHTHPDGSSHSADECPLHRTIARGEAHRALELLWRSDGSAFPVEYISTPLLEDGKVTGAVVAFSDISTRLAAEQERDQALRAVAVREETLANSVINALPGLYFLLDREGRPVRWNRRLEEVSGLSGEEIARISPLDLVAEPDRDRAAAAIEEVFASGRAQVEAGFLDRDGNAVPCLFTGTRVILDGKPYLNGNGIDITEQKRSQQELEEAATHDHLTGAFNRMHGDRTLERAIRHAQRYRRPLSVILFDIDDFKRVNDTFGHDAGDDVLKTLTRVTRERLRETDVFVRWGGEEFLVITEETGAAGAATLAEEIRRAVAAADVGEAGGVTVSLGVAEFGGRERKKELLRRVDEALYRAKAEGKDCVREA